MYGHLIKIVSAAAVISTILQFLSGILVCKQYVVNRTTGESSPLPFICGVVSCTVWLFYGLIKPDDNIVITNTIGITLMLAYLVVFCIYTVMKVAVLKLIVVTVICLLALITYTTTAQDYDLLLGHLGLLACSLTLLTIVSPMSKLFYVMKVKNTECLPFPMILMSFFVSSFWCCYGILVEDPYLTMTNFIGGTLAAFQLVLFIIYPSRSSPAKTISA